MIFTGYIVFYELTSRLSTMTTAGTEIWHPDDGHNLDMLANSIRHEMGKNVYKSEVLDVIEVNIDSLSDELRALSLDIHGESSISRFLGLRPKLNPRSP